MTYEYVKQAYGVNPVVGERVVGIEGLEGYGQGTIKRESRSQAHYVMVKFDSGRSGACHPGELKYLGKVEA